MTLVVLMAGGRGLRLRPLTDKTPKPMVHVGEKPIIQQIMEGYREQGFNRFVFCVGYRADVIRNHFGDGSFWDVEIAYVQDPVENYLGTAGALHFLGGAAEGEIIVQNADILTKVDYTDLVCFHRAHQAEATVCASTYQHQVPYGVLDLAGDWLGSIAEKPVQSWPVGAGIYVLSNKALQMVPKGYYDMPDLIERLDKVAVYHLRNHWTDVGTLQSLEDARRDWA